MGPCASTVRHGAAPPLCVRGAIPHVPPLICSRAPARIRRLHPPARVHSLAHVISPSALPLTLSPSRAHTRSIEMHRADEQARADAHAHARSLHQARARTQAQEPVQAHAQASSSGLGGGGGGGTPAASGGGMLVAYSVGAGRRGGGGAAAGGAGGAAAGAVGSVGGDARVPLSPTRRTLRSVAMKVIKAKPGSAALSPHAPAPQTQALRSVGATTARAAGAALREPRGGASVAMPGSLQGVAGPGATAAATGSNQGESAARMPDCKLCASFSSC